MRRGPFTGRTDAGCPRPGRRGPGRARPPLLSADAAPGRPSLGRARHPPLGTAPNAPAPERSETMRKRTLAPALALAVAFSLTVPTPGRAASLEPVVEVLEGTAILLSQSEGGGGAGGDNTTGS